MLPKDKYTLFARYEKKYRKGIHSKFPAQYPLGTDGDLTNSCRAAEVDEGFTTSQSSWILKPRRTRIYLVHGMYDYGLDLSGVFGIHVHYQEARYDSSSAIELLATRHTVFQIARSAYESTRTLRKLLEVMDSRSISWLQGRLGRFAGACSVKLDAERGERGSSFMFEEDSSQT